LGSSENTIWELAGSAENFPECPIISTKGFPAQLYSTINKEGENDTKIQI